MARWLVVAGSIVSATDPQSHPAHLPSLAPGAVPLRRGWNLGNTLDFEDRKTNLREEWMFESAAEKGFDWVRIPIYWGCRTEIDSPYTVNATFMTMVQETVDWAHKHGLRAMINTHHEDWLDRAGDQFSQQLERFLAIWDQVAKHFVSYPDDKLVFEIFNEPKDMSVDDLNQMHLKSLEVIRRSNPTRQVHIGGLHQMNLAYFLDHLDEMVVPDDAHLALTVHSYYPWKFAGIPPTIFNFTDADAQTAYDQHAALVPWAAKNGITAIVTDEMGVTHFQPNKDARLRYYTANTEAMSQLGQGYALWDDNGWWQVLNREDRTWDEGVLASLAPVKLQAVV